MKPWEKYQGSSTDSQKPWEKYSAVAQQPDKPVDSMSTMGIKGYAAAHPFKTAFNDPVETATGKSMLERSQESTVFNKPPSNLLEGIGEFGAGYARDVGAAFGGAAASPVSVATYGFGALPAAGKTLGQVAFKAVAGTKVGQAVGKLLNQPIQQVGKNIGTKISNAPKAVKSYFNFDQQGLDLATKVRGVAAEIKNAEVNKFGVSQKMLQEANPSKRISLRNVVEDINANMQDMAPEAKSVFRKVPRLKEMLDNPQLADNISLPESQEIINYFNTKIPANIKYNHLDILDALTDIRAAQLDAFDEMGSIREVYGRFKNDYNLIKNSLRPGATVKAIRNNFNNNPEIQAAAKRLFKPELIKEMSKHRGKLGAVRVIKKALGYGIGAGILGRVGMEIYR